MAASRTAKTTPQTQRVQFRQPKTGKRAVKEPITSGKRGKAAKPAKPKKSTKPTLTKAAKATRATQATQSGRSTRSQTKATQSSGSTGSKVVVYCRVSTGDQSCERQERDLLGFAKRAKYRVLKVFKETASGAKTDRAERDRVMQLARERQVEAILVTELTRWGRSTGDLLDTLQELDGYGVSLIAQTGLQFDLRSPQGKLFATLLAALAEFERDLIRERVRSGIAAAKARGVKIGRQKGQRPSDRKAPRVRELRKQGDSYREIARKLDLDKNTVMDILNR